MGACKASPTISTGLSATIRASHAGAGLRCLPSWMLPSNSGKPKRAPKPWGLLMNAPTPALLNASEAESGEIRFVIRGEPASKANSRELVTHRWRDEEDRPRSRPMFIKSGKARDFEHDAQLQIPAVARVELLGPVRVTMHIFYASERPDLDESVILDVMQSRYCRVHRNGREERECVRRGVYLNDRQVYEKHIYKAFDRLYPRAEILVEPLTPEQTALAFATPGAV